MFFFQLSWACFFSIEFAFQLSWVCFFCPGFDFSQLFWVWFFSVVLGLTFLSCPGFDFSQFNNRRGAIGPVTYGPISTSRQPSGRSPLRQYLVICFLHSPHRVLHKYWRRQEPGLTNICRQVACAYFTLLPCILTWLRFFHALFDFDAPRRPNSVWKWKIPKNRFF